VPSPKLHFHEVEIPVFLSVYGNGVLLSVNCTFSGASPEVGVAEKVATGDLKGTVVFSSVIIIVI